MKMSSNPFKEQKECYNYIEQILTKHLPNFKEGISYKQLIKELLLKFAVSKRSIEIFIYENYLEEGIVELKGGVLKSLLKKE